MRAAGLTAKLCDFSLENREASFECLHVKLRVLRLASSLCQLQTKLVLVFGRFVTFGGSSFRLMYA